jgi:hypothetical protein
VSSELASYIPQSMRVATGERDRTLQPLGATVGTQANGLARPLDVLFVLRSLATLRYFQSSLELLTERGNNVRLLLEEHKHGPVEQAWLDQMLERPNFACDTPVHFRRNVWHRRGVTFRAGMEYVHFLGPAYQNRPRYGLKALRRSPPPSIQRLSALPLIRTPLGLRLLYRILSPIERALPEPTGVTEYVERLRPDVIALGDYGSRASLNSTFVRAAKKQGIPTATCVASWDNLTTRPRMSAIPHRVVVWNETQRQEAVELHSVPTERVVVTGAPNFDQWFGWKPRPREEFLERVGLDPVKPVVLWVGAALNHWERPEAEFVFRWLAALRSSGDSVLQGAGVLLRPHPLRLQHWLDADFSGYANVTMWPRGEMTMPVDVEQKADYYDSIFHSAAVVGINTSAMIEASIVGRPVLTVLEPVHHDSQFGALHFEYLLDSGGGALRLASTLEEHFSELGAILAGRDGEPGEATRRFLTRFVRPHGLDRPSTPIFVETLEQLAADPVTPEHDPLWVGVLRRLIMLVMVLITPCRMKSVRRFSNRRRLAKSARRLSKRLRRFTRRIPVVAPLLLSKRTRRLAKRTRRFLVIVLALGIRIRLQHLRRRLREASAGRP